MTYPIKPSDTVFLMMGIIDGCKALDRHIDDELKPQSFLFNEPQYSEIEIAEQTQKAQQLEMRYKGLTCRFGEDVLNALSKEIDTVAQSAKSPFKEKIQGSQRTLKELTDKLPAKINQYPAAYAQTKRIEKLIFDYTNIRHSMRPSIEAVSPFKDRLTVLETEEQIKPESFTPAQKDSLLELHFDVADVYEKSLYVILNDLCELARGNAALDENSQKEARALLEKLPPKQFQDAIYGKVWALSTGDRQGDNWGKDHALDNPAIFKKAILEVAKQEIPNFVMELEERFAIRPSEEKKTEEKTSQAEPTPQQKALFDMSRQVEAMKSWDKELHGDSVRNLLEALDPASQEKITLKVWEKAGKPEGNPNFGIENAGNDLDSLLIILRDVFIDTLPESQKEDAKAEIIEEEKREKLINSVSAALKAQAAAKTLD